MKHSSSRPLSQRQLRVGEQIRQALSEIFMRGECHEPLLDGASITVSEVRISPDLKNATAYIMPLAGMNREEVLTRLNDFAPVLRRFVTDRIILRFSPKLFFKLDGSFDEASKIDALLRKPEVQRDLEKK